MKVEIVSRNNRIGHYLLFLASHPGFVNYFVFKQVDNKSPISKSRDIAIESFKKSLELDKKKEFVDNNKSSPFLLHEVHNFYLYILFSFFFFYFIPNFLKTGFSISTKISFHYPRKVSRFFFKNFFNKFPFMFPKIYCRFIFFI